MKFASSISRLSDPDNIAGENLSVCQEKLAAAITRMFAKPENGGNPFLFAISGPKPHILKDMCTGIGKPTKLTRTVAVGQTTITVRGPKRLKKDSYVKIGVGEKQELNFIVDVAGKTIVLKKGVKFEHKYGSPAFVVTPTAATNGKVYFWHPEVLVTSTIPQISWMMDHETYHDVFGHCRAGRALGRQRQVWNIALDYADNSVIEEDRRRNGRNTDEVWTGTAVFGKPMPLAKYLDWIDGNDNALLDSNGKPSMSEFVDITVFGRSPESIYSDIMEHIRNSPRRCPKCGGLNLSGKKKPEKTEEEKEDEEKKEDPTCPKCGKKKGKKDKSKGQGQGKDKSKDKGQGQDKSKDKSDKPGECGGEGEEEGDGEGEGKGEEGEDGDGEEGEGGGGEGEGESEGEGKGKGKGKGDGQGEGQGQGQGQGVQDCGARLSWGRGE